MPLHFLRGHFQTTFAFLSVIMTLRGGGWGLGLDVSIDHKSRHAWLSNVTEAELLCLGQSKDKYMKIIYWQVVPDRKEGQQ